MSSRVKILSENLCNQIAAGEVVERPFSVVKELVENALDADADEIRITVERGGKFLIRVEDNGTGMSREDLFLCLERHATSKIATAEDLFRLATLGFRGEALPSIAAVSRLKLASRQQDALDGFEIHASGGKVEKAHAAGLPRGTLVEVRNLFFNTPARKKFLKSEQTEFAHIGDFVSKIALSFPSVRISLEHNRRSHVNLFQHQSLADRAAALLGAEMFKALTPFEKSGPEGIRVHGYAGSPDLHRGSASAVYSFVNRRFVRDRLFQHAVMEGYRNLLPRHRYPVVILFLDIPPTLVDVNVHPAKREVRFRNQGQVHDFIASSIRDALRVAASSGASSRSSATDWSVPMSDKQVRADASRQYADKPLPEYREYPHCVREVVAVPDREAEPDRSESVNEAAEEGETLSFLPKQPDFQQTDFFASLQLIGQYRSSYIVCQAGEDLVLIDQHAAHERIGFERLKQQFDSGKIESQELLFPKTLEFGFREAAALEENRPRLLTLGFGLEPYGGRVFLLRSVPALLDPELAAGVVKEILEEIAALGDSRVMTRETDKILVTMACHSMIRANQSLSMAEMKSLLRDMDSVDFNAYCPHGRPAVARLSLRSIEKLFHRP